MKMNEEKFQQEIFDYVDRIKDFLSPEMWQNILLDCSKNELFIMWLLYRNHEVNMTQIAEYIHAPLNTATGIINRMEKKELISRERSIEDKRIVSIRLGKRGEEQIKAVLKEFMYYGKKVVSAFGAEEMQLFFRMIDKLEEVMKEEHKKGKHETETGKKKIKKIEIN